MEPDFKKVDAISFQPIPLAAYPRLAQQPLHKIPANTTNLHISLQIMAMLEYMATAAGAKMDTRPCERDIVVDMGLHKRNEFDQISLSPTPFHKSFEEIIDISK
jgi:hypothetical protein